MMKKTVYCLLALATLLMAASCGKELESKEENAGGTANITLDVSLGPQTKAFADGTTVDKLYAGLYEVNGSDYTWVADNSDAPAAISGKAANVTFSGKIILGKSYKVVFWAQKDGAPYSIDWAKDLTTGPTVTASFNGSANDESRDAFYGVYETGTVTGSIDLTGSPVSLKRPFAQVNVLVPNENLVDPSAEAGSSMRVFNAPTMLNLATKETTSPTDWFFSASSINEAAFGSYASTHKYVAMNYVLVDQTAADPRYTIEFFVTAGTQTLDNKRLENIPFRPNVRTNIVGNLFNLNYDLSVSLSVSPGFND